MELREEMSHLLETLSTRIEENIDNQDMAVVVRVLDRMEDNLLELVKDSGD